MRSVPTAPHEATDEKPDATSVAAGVGKPLHGREAVTSAMGTTDAGHVPQDDAITTSAPPE
jgi:hypothetical protein